MNIVDLDPKIMLPAYIAGFLFYFLAIIYVTRNVKVGSTRNHTIVYLAFFGFRYVFLVTGLDGYLDALYSNFFHAVDLIFQLWGFLFVFTAYYTNLSNPYSIPLALLGGVFCTMVMIFVYAPSVVGLDVTQREYVHGNLGAVFSFLVMISFVFSLFSALFFQSFRTLKQELNPILISRYSYMLVSTGAVCFGSLFASIGILSTYFLGSDKNVFLLAAELMVVISFLIMFPVLVMFFLPNWIQEKIGLVLKQKLVSYRIKKLKRISLVISNYCKPYESEDTHDLDYELQKLVIHILDGLPYLREGDSYAKDLASLLDPIENMFPDEQIKFLMGVRIA